MNEFESCLGVLGDLGGRVLVGVSGGVDSMALLHLLGKVGFRDVVVCHLNHGLRGEDSDGDEEFVRGVARKMGCEFAGERVDLRGLIKQGGSLETVGREARHDFFGRCAVRFGCERLVLGHHADDQAETVLWNLMRGSCGFRGMSEVHRLDMGGRWMEVLRPFLRVRKSKLRGWMEREGFEWREDVTNQQNDVVRNRMRNEVFPLLDEIARRDVRPMFVRAAEESDEWRELLEWVAGKADVLDPQGRVHVRVFQALPAVIQKKVMVDFLKAAGVSGIDTKLIESCVGLVDVVNGPSVNLPGGKWLRRRQGRIFVQKESGGRARF